MSVTGALERVGQRGDPAAIRSTVARTDAGQAEVRVLGLTCNPVGARARFDEAPAAGAMPEGLPGSSTVAPAKHCDEPGGGEAILRHGVLSEGATALPSAPSGPNPGEAVSRDLVFYADPTGFGSVRFLVELPHAKMSEPPVPPAFEVGRDGRIAAVPGPGDDRLRHGVLPLAALSRSIAAAMRSTPREDRAFFPLRVATARRPFGRALGFSARRRLA